MAKRIIWRSEIDQGEVVLLEDGSVMVDTDDPQERIQLTPELVRQLAEKSRKLEREGEGEQ